LIILLIVCAVVYLAAYLSKTKRVSFKIRRLAALDAMNEAIGRATEMGRPVHFTAGDSDLIGADSSMMIAGITLLGFIARAVARYNARLLVSVGSDQTLPMTIETVKQAYQAEGREDAFQLDSIRYIPTTAMAFSAAVTELIVSEKVASNIMVGGFSNLAIFLAEAGFRAGAIQIGGNPRLVQMPYFAISCDHLLIGEEVYSTGAYLSDDPETKGTIGGQDISKILVMGVLLIGVLLMTVGNPMVLNWLRS
jgi:hypothetical protein